MREDGGKVRIEGGREMRESNVTPTVLTVRVVCALMDRVTRFSIIFCDHNSTFLSFAKSECYLIIIMLQKVFAFK